MKKLLFLIVTASFAFAAPTFAQGKGNGNGKWKKQKTQKQNKQWDRNDDDRYDRDGRWDDRRNDDRRYDNNNGKYSKNAPRKVRDAFYRDYPNARNVSWTKDRGVWTAHFDGGGWFGGNNRVSYAANGQRVGSNNNGTYGRNDRVRTTDRRYDPRYENRTQTRTGSDVFRKATERFRRN